VRYRNFDKFRFGVLIGQPMKAAIEAQALAAKTTIEFIEKVGFVQPIRIKTCCLSMNPKMPMQEKCETSHSVHQER